MGISGIRVRAARATCHAPGPVFKSLAVDGHVAYPTVSHRIYTPCPNGRRDVAKRLSHAGLGLVPFGGALGGPGAASGGFPLGDSTTDFDHEAGLAAAVRRVGAASTRGALSAGFPLATGVVVSVHDASGRVRSSTFSKSSTANPGNSKRDPRVHSPDRLPVVFPAAIQALRILALPRQHHAPATARTRFRLPVGHSETALRPAGCKSVRVSRARLIPTYIVR